MKNIYISIKKYRNFAVVGVVVLFIAAYFLIGNTKNSVEIYTVKKESIEQSVELSGKVQTTDKADLGFAVSGRVAKIFVKNNQSVKQGDALAQLEIGDLLADLQIKQANSKTSDVDLKSAQDELAKVTQQENTKVANAYRTLLSESLVLTPEDKNFEVAVPTVTGIYDGSEGSYKIIVYKKNVTLPDFTLLTFSLERTEKIISETSPTALGTRGLYISFPKNKLSDYIDTTWYLDIPNKTSSSYLANLNAYNAALDEQDIAIKNAKAAYDKLLTKGDDGSSVAQAEINKIQAEIRKNTIYSPFSGKVTNIQKEIGENAAIGETVVTVLGENKLEIVFKVSELDVSKLQVGAPIKISLDAIPKEELSGVLTTVNSKETEIDGVPVYEAFVSLNPDPRIKNGMTANGVVVLVHKDSVVAVPSYLIENSNGKSFVNLEIAPGKFTKKEITLGLTSTDSMVEVISGINVGDRLEGSSSK